MMAGREWTQKQREAADQARRELVEQLHQRLADGIATLDNRDEWQRYLAFAHSFRTYSFAHGPVECASSVRNRRSHRSQCSGDAHEG